MLALAVFAAVPVLAGCSSRGGRSGAGQRPGRGRPRPVADPPGRRRGPGRPRHRPGPVVGAPVPPAPRCRRPGDLPKQTDANIPIEVFYTVVPLVIVAVLFGLTMRTQNRVDPARATPPISSRRGHRVPVGLAVPLPGPGGNSRRRRQQPSHPRPARGRQCPAAPDGRRRHPLVLRARLPREEGPDPGGGQRHRDPAHASVGPLPGVLRRVLRARPLAHDLRRGGGPARGVPGLRRRTAAGAGGPGRDGTGPGDIGRQARVDRGVRMR